MEQKILWRKGWPSSGHWKQVITRCRGPWTLTAPSENRREEMLLKAKVRGTSEDSSLSVHSTIAWSERQENKSILGRNKFVPRSDVVMDWLWGSSFYSASGYAGGKHSEQDRMLRAEGSIHCGLDVPSGTHAGVCLTATGVARGNRPCGRWLSFGSPAGGVAMKMQSPSSLCAESSAMFPHPRGSSNVQTLILDSSASTTIKQTHNCCLSITQFVAFHHSCRKQTSQVKRHPTEWETNFLTAHLTEYHYLRSIKVENLKNQQTKQFNQ